MSQEEKKSPSAEEALVLWRAMRDRAPGTDAVSMLREALAAAEARGREAAAQLAAKEAIEYEAATERGGEWQNAYQFAADALWLAIEKIRALAPPQSLPTGGSPGCAGGVETAQELADLLTTAPRSKGLDHLLDQPTTQDEPEAMHETPEKAQRFLGQLAKLKADPARDFVDPWETAQEQPRDAALELLREVLAILRKHEGPWMIPLDQLSRLGDMRLLIADVNTVIAKLRAALGEK